MARVRETRSPRTCCALLQGRWVMRTNKKALPARDAKRDIGAELLQAVRDVKAGKGKTYTVPAAALAKDDAIEHALYFGRCASNSQLWLKRRRIRGIARG